MFVNKRVEKLERKVFLLSSEIQLLRKSVCSAGLPQYDYWDYVNNGVFTEINKSLGKKTVVKRGSYRKTAKYQYKKLKVTKAYLEEIARQYSRGVSEEEIARHLKIEKATLKNYLRVAKHNNLI